MFVKTRLNCKKIAQFAQKQEMQKGKGEWLFLLGLNDDLIFLVHQSQRQFVTPILIMGFLMGLFPF
jgi:hypothetical protein